MEAILKKINGVTYLTKKQDSFTKAYIKTRKEEGRILSDVQVKRLPHLLKDRKNYAEWQLRQKSTERFISYLKNKNYTLSILDIGCGNGWFANLMSSVSNKNKILGLDINTLELEQASRVFCSENLEFAYGNLFKINTEFKSQFDIITLNACMQYFSDFKILLLQLQSFLKPNGEIHIIDSPFYKPSDIESAKKRSEAYYKSIGVAEMSEHYFHHSVEKIKDFKVLYSPSKSIFNKIFKKKDSPFMWLRFRKVLAL